MTPEAWMLVAMVLVALSLVVGGFLALLAPDLMGRL